jgi:DNA primase
VVLPERLLGVFERCPLTLLKAGFSERILFEHDVGFDKELRRITFPIRTKTGQLVGIVGRRQDPKYGKYKVYTSELLKYGFNIESFPKGDYLWREEKASRALGPGDDLYVVEGFKAALWFAQAELPTVVALMGSRMSERQQEKLISYGRRIILCLDNDAAGRKATLEIGHKLKSARRYVVPLPEGIHQPDDLSEFELVDLVQNPVTLAEAKRTWLESP